MIAFWQPQDRLVQEQNAKNWPEEMLGWEKLESRTAVLGFASLRLCGIGFFVQKKVARGLCRFAQNDVVQGLRRFAGNEIVPV